LPPRCCSGVAIIVPNAFYPGAFDHPMLVMAGDSLAALQVILILKLAPTPTRTRTL
jgi:hypothetical protein